MNQQSFLRVLPLVLITTLITATAIAQGTPNPSAPATETPPPVETPMETPPGLPPGFVYLDNVDATIVQDIRYAGDHNFLGRRVKGYEAPRCILTEPTAYALAEVQESLRAQKLSLKVYDCYRPQIAVDDFVDWGKDLSDQKMKAEFYPRVAKQDVFPLGYIMDKSGHSRGSTVDITLVPVPTPKQPLFKADLPLQDCTRPKGKRFNDNSLDMGTGYDCFDPLAYTMNSDIPALAHQNRRKLKNLMEQAGFKNLREEWWHYTLKQEPFPETYFGFPVR